MSRDLIASHLGSCGYLTHPNGRLYGCSPAARRIAQKVGYCPTLIAESERIKGESDHLLLPRLPAPSEAGHLQVLEWILARQR